MRGLGEPLPLRVCTGLPAAVNLAARGRRVVVRQLGPQPRPPGEPPHSANKGGPAPTRLLLARPSTN